MLIDRNRFTADRPGRPVDRPLTEAEETRRVPKQKELSELSLKVRDLEPRVTSSVVQPTRPDDDSQAPCLLVMSGHREVRVEYDHDAEAYVWAAGPDKGASLGARGQAHVAALRVVRALRRPITAPEPVS